MVSLLAGEHGIVCSLTTQSSQQGRLPAFVRLRLQDMPQGACGYCVAIPAGVDMQQLARSETLSKSVPWM